MKYAKSYVVMALKILMKDVMIQIQMIWTDVQLFVKLKLDGPALDFLQVVFLYVVMGQYSQSLVMMLILKQEMAVTGAKLSQDGNVL